MQLISARAQIARSSSPTLQFPCCLVLLDQLHGPLCCHWYACRLQVSNLTERAIDELQQHLVPDLCSHYRYILNPSLYERLELGPAHLHPRPKQIDMSVCIIDENGRERNYSLNHECVAGDVTNIPAQIRTQRAILSYECDRPLLPFTLPIPLETASGRTVHAFLFLEYYPFKAGAETLPSGVQPGVDVLWQGHLLSLEAKRHFAFMQNDNQDPIFWRSSRGRDLARKLEQQGGRVYGELLLTKDFDVTKNKSMLLRNPQSDKPGTKRAWPLPFAPLRCVTRHSRPSQ